MTCSNAALKARFKRGVMFVCMLKCPSCYYESDSFFEGYDVHTDTHTVLCKNLLTRVVRFVRLANSELPFAAKDDSSIEDFARADNEEVVRTQIGVEEELDAICPNCGHQRLLKEVVGIH